VLTEPTIDATSKFDRQLLIHTRILAGKFGDEEQFGKRSWADFLVICEASSTCLPSTEIASPRPTNLRGSRAVS
jgi:hypothetical protein